MRQKKTKTEKGKEAAPAGVKAQSQQKETNLESQEQIQPAMRKNDLEI